MIVMPAIDVRGGKVVRLKQGQLQEETVYGSDPRAVARKWEQEGARRLHVVDLDAAVSGKPQFDAIAAVIDAVKIPVEVGGGLRVLEIAMRYRDRGADRVGGRGHQVAVRHLRARLEHGTLRQHERVAERDRLVAAVETSRGGGRAQAAGAA